MGLLITPVSRPIFFMLSGYHERFGALLYPSRSSQEHSFHPEYFFFSEHHFTKKNEKSA
jgi:hypothetical protein